MASLLVQSMSVRQYLTVQEKVGREILLILEQHSSNASMITQNLLMLPQTFA